MKLKPIYLGNNVNLDVRPVRKKESREKPRIICINQKKGKVSMGSHNEKSYSRYSTSTVHRKKTTLNQFKPPSRNISSNSKTFSSVLLVRLEVGKTRLGLVMSLEELCSECTSTWFQNNRICVSACVPFKPSQLWYILPL